DTQGRAWKAEGVVTAATVGGSNEFVGYPDWWNLKTEQPDGYARGHLFAGFLGGDGGKEWNNMVPLFHRANSVAMLECEKRVRDAAQCGHCVEYTVEAVYEVGVKSRIPEEIHIVAKSKQGFALDVTIPNLKTAQPPAGCKSSAFNFGGS